MLHWGLSAIENYTYGQVFAFPFDVKYIATTWFPSVLSKYGFLGIDLDVSVGCGLPLLKSWLYYLLGLYLLQGTSSVCTALIFSNMGMIIHGKSHVKTDTDR